MGNDEMHLCSGRDVAGHLPLRHELCSVGRLMSEELRIILTTFPSAEVARGIVTQLVAEQCIACGNLVPGVLSLYHWQGQLCEEQEVLGLLKTSLSALPAAMARLAELHPYEVPELVVLEPEQVSTAYAAWVAAQVRGG